MEENYAKAYKEVMEILKHVPKESINKIPDTMIKIFEEKMDKNYRFKIDTNKKFEEQDLLEETKAILANIFRDYWATPYQKERIEVKEKFDIQEIEEEKRIKYNPDDLFKKRLQEAQSNIDEYNYKENLPIELKKENFFKKMIKFIKKIFYRK